MRYGIPGHPPKRGAAGLALAALIALAGCGSDSGHGDHEHDEESVTIDTAGRLAIAEQGAPTLRLLDLDSGAVAATLALEHPPSSLYASPGRRYVVAVQRTQDRVQFVDGGIWQEDHGDHLHDYKEAPRLSGWTLTGPQPTHYDVQWGRQAALFMDGRGTASPPQLASVHVFTDASIGHGSAIARLDLGVAIHGLAEPKDDVLLGVHREADAPDALPTHLQVYRRTGATYALERRLASRCNGMHGSGSSGAYTVVGCVDGVVAVTHGAAIADRKIATATRVGTVAAHPAADGHFIGYGNAGTPSTTRFHAVDARNGTAAELVPEGWTPGTLLRAQAFERGGQRWFVLDSLGHLTVMARGASGWTTVHRTTNLVPAMPSAAPFPQMAANGARDELYVTDPVARQLIVLDTVGFSVKSRRDLDHVPGLLAWTGIAR
jgi:hypothetical protein